MMAVTDGTSETPAPKQRKVPHYEAIAKAAEKLAADRLTQLEREQQTSLILATKLAKLRGVATLAIAEFLVIGWLAFWHYKP